MAFPFTQNESHKPDYKSFNSKSKLQAGLIYASSHYQTAQDFNAKKVKAASESGGRQQRNPIQKSQIPTSSDDFERADDGGQLQIQMNHYYDYVKDN